MVFTRKFSEFAPGDVDEVVGLTSGANTIGPNSGGGSGSGGVIVTITQDTSGLAVAQWVRFDNAAQMYVPALADTAEHAEIEGVVLEILSSTEFKLQQSGYIAHGTPGFTGLSTTGTYFLSDLSAGAMTLTPSTTNGHIRLPVFMADSSDSGWVASLKTGMVIGSPGPIPSGGGGGGGSDSSIHQISQPGNGFSIGNFVRVSGNTIYSLASGASFDASQGVGVVTASGDPLFTLQFSGYNLGAVTAAVDSTGAPIALISGQVYYLSDIVPGAICPTKPTNINASVKPAYICESSSSFSGYILPQQPLLVEPNESNTIIVNQSTAGLAVGNVVRVLGSGTYTKALADNLADARAVGIITEIIDATHFILQTSGFSTFSGMLLGLTPGAQYWLSETVPGLLTLTEPSANGTVSKPMLCALTSSSGFILEQRPMLQPNANGGGSGGGSGNPIQVIYSAVSLTSNGDLPIGASITITPSSSSNRIRLTIASAAYVPSLSNAGLMIKRNGALIPAGSGFIMIGARSSASGTYIDSPATTSAVTYSLYCAANQTGASGAYSLLAGYPIILTAEEVGP